MHCRIFISLLGLFPLYASSNTPFVTIKMSSDISKCPLQGISIPSLELLREKIKIFDWLEMNEPAKKTSKE